MSLNTLNAVHFQVGQKYAPAIEVQNSSAARILAAVAAQPRQVFATRPNPKKRLGQNSATCGQNPFLAAQVLFTELLRSYYRFSQPLQHNTMRHTIQNGQFVSHRSEQLILRNLFYNDDLWHGQLTVPRWPKVRAMEQDWLLS